MLTAALFQKKFESDLLRVNRRIESYLESSSEENIRDVRTAIRRLETTSKLLSRALRRGRVSKYIDLCKKFFKISNELRDLDIIQAKLSMYFELNSHKSTFKRIKNRRKELLVSSRKVARKIKRRKPELDASRIRENKLRKGFDKVVFKLNGVLQYLLPIVLKDSENVKELHLFRKICKRLRYLLEVDTSREGSSTLTDLLKKWQDLLGEIRDSDVTIDYLKRLSQTKSVAEALTTERNVRDHAYKKFVGLFGWDAQAVEGALLSADKVKAEESFFNSKTYRTID